MKAKELMIGDFVAINEPDNYHGYIGKVCIINDVTGYITVFIENHDYHDVLCDDMQPIPLTPEILEENGFKEDIRTDAWGRPSTKARSWTDTKDFDEDDIGYEYYISLRYYKDEWLLQISTNHRSAFNAIVAHVHELQHALKLCGIEKEIQL